MPFCWWFKRKYRRSYKSWYERFCLSSKYTRVRKIYRKYLKGNTIDELTKEYFLSEKSIRRIINKQKQLKLQNQEEKSTKELFAGVEI